MRLTWARAIDPGKPSRDRVVTLRTGWGEEDAIELMLRGTRRSTMEDNIFLFVPNIIGKWAWGDGEMLENYDENSRSLILPF